MNLILHQKTAERHLQDIVDIVFCHTPEQQALIIYDERSELSKCLTSAYQSILPDANAFHFDHSDPDTILDAFETLEAGDLVVLIQSTSFRLSKFRIRLELFNRKIKVIEHPHLARMREEELETYIHALAYDPSYYRTLGPQLKNQIDQANEIKITSEGRVLIYDSSFLGAKLNIGDYTGMKNIGGQFPIGEVFTEPADLDRLNGEVKIFAFGDASFSVNTPDTPFTVQIEKGILVYSDEAPERFQIVLNDIREKEEVVWVRELGFGLNRAFTREQRVTDIGTYERMCGIHLSLGSKHLQYKKTAFPNKGGFHVDVFVEAKRVEIDGLTVYQDGRYLDGLS